MIRSVEGGNVVYRYSHSIGKSKMIFSNKYSRLIPLHLLLFIVSCNIPDLIKTDQFLLEESIRTYGALTIIIYMEVKMYWEINNSLG